MTKQRKRDNPQEREPIEEIARALPEAHDAERSVLGSIIMDSKQLFVVMETLSDEHFTLSSHRQIYRSILQLSAENKPIDIISISENLKEWQQLDAIGGVSYLASLTDALTIAYRSDSLRYAANKIIETAHRRQLHAMLQRATFESLDVAVSVEEVIGRVEGDVLSLMSGTTAKSKPEKIDDGALRVVVSLHEQRLSQKRVLGVSYGFRTLDETTTGMREGEYTIVAARPGAGKTAFAIGVAVENADFDTPVGIFSVEMRRDELIARMLSRQSGVNHLLLRDPRALTPEQLTRLEEEAERLKRMPIWIDDTGSIHIREVIARSRKLVHEGCKLLIFDYVQLIHGDGADARERLNHVSEMLREFAKAQRVPIMVLSQLSRADKSNRDKEPHINDLKESSNLEQDAHVVLLLHREIDSEGEPTMADWIRIAKQRNGPTGRLPFEFRGASLSWGERTPKPKEKQAETPKAPAAEQQTLLGKEAGNDADF